MTARAREWPHCADARRPPQLAGKAKGTEELPISVRPPPQRRSHLQRAHSSPPQIRLIAPPLFVVTTQALDVEAGVALLTEAITEVKEKVEAKGGTLNVKMAVRCAPRGAWGARVRALTRRVARRAAAGNKSAGRPRAVDAHGAAGEGEQRGGRRHGGGRVNADAPSGASMNRTVPRVAAPILPPGDVVGSEDGRHQHQRRARGGRAGAAAARHARAP